MNTKSLFRSAVYILWGVALVWGVVYAGNLVYEAISTQNPNVPWYVNDIFSDVVMLFVAFMPVLWAPKFFGYQFGDIARHWKMLLGMAVFFVGAPLLYRLILGDKEAIYNDLYSAIQSARELIPNVKVEIIPAAHHVTAVANPEKVNQKLLEFFAE